MYQQRSAPAPTSLQGRGVWRPRVEPEEVELEPEAEDRYAVVDDIEGERVVLVLDPWPQVGASGHLVFSGQVVTRDFLAADLQRLVNRQRAAAQQPAASRALRVGDVFWLRADGDRGLHLSQGWRLLDITGPARRAARAAQIVAANPALRALTDKPVGEPEEPSTDADTQAQRPAAGTAPPAV